MKTAEEIISEGCKLCQEMAHANCDGCYFHKLYTAAKARPGVHVPILEYALLANEINLLNIRLSKMYEKAKKVVDIEPALMRMDIMGKTHVMAAIERAEKIIYGK
mgnify:CR=1 FL=1